MKPISKRTMIAIFALVLISPIFGVILADIVGFHEPLDLAAEDLNLPDKTEDTNWTPFLDYTIPGLSPEVGYIVAGIMGVTIILAIGLAIRKLVKQH